MREERWCEGKEGVGGGGSRRKEGGERRVSEVGARGWVLQRVCGGAGVRGEGTWRWRGVQLNYTN